MFQKIFTFTIGAIVAIPVLLWFAIQGIFTGSWKLMAFVCQCQYRELKRLCESGTAVELQAFLTTHPGAKEYIVYARQGATTSVIISLFRLPSPLTVAYRANNMAVIPVLLANGASPEIRSIAADQSPAEEAIGNPDKMRALCSGKIWWLEHTARTDSLEAKIKERNYRGIIWNVMRGARLTNFKMLTKVGFLHLQMVMKEFLCHFGIDEKKRKEFYSQLKTLSSEERKQIITHHFKSPVGYQGVRLEKEFSEMLQAMEKTLLPLPAVDDDAMERLKFSTGLMDRRMMLELLNTLFNMDQQFAMLEQCTCVPPSKNNRELIEDVVDLMLCSILKNAGDKM